MLNVFTVIRNNT